GAAHLMRIGLAGDIIGKVRHPAGMPRRSSSRKARHRKIKTAPEEMYRAGLAEEAGAELLEHAVSVDKDLEKAPHRVRIVGGMLGVLREADRFRQLIGHLVDFDVNAEIRQRGHDGGVET